MKPQLINRGLRLAKLFLLVVACLVVACLSVYWFSTGGFVRDELLSQIKPGMTVESVHNLLGKPMDVNDYIIWGPSHNSLDWRGPRYGWRWESKRDGLIANAPEEASRPYDNEYQRHFWVSKQRMLLWVEFQGGKVFHVWVVPLKSPS